MNEPERTRATGAADAPENEERAGEPADGASETAPAADAERTPSLEELTEELERTRGAYMRAVADYQNLQRRSREERAEQARLITKTLVLNYLPVLDDLNRALDSVSQHPELAEHPWVEGVRMVQRKFTGVLEGAGVRQVEAGAGVPFNPQYHEAVAYQPGPLNEVVAVIQNGYAIDSTIIRPAMVIVGNGEPAPGAGSHDGERKNG